MTQAEQLGWYYVAATVALTLWIMWAVWFYGDEP